MYNENRPISTGNKYFDDLFGGIDANSLTLIEEKYLSLYSDMLLKLFISQGLLDKHQVVVISADFSFEEFFTSLPKHIDKFLSKDNSFDQLDISRRYKNLKDFENIRSFNSSGFCSGNFDFSTTYELSDLLKMDNLHFIRLTDGNLYDSILNHIDKIPLDRTCRLVLHSIGSISYCETPEYNLKLLKFLMRLKTIEHIRMFILMSIPISQYEQNGILLKRIESLCDNVICLKSFNYDETYESQFKNYNGIFHIEKIANINNLPYKIAPPENDLAFQIRKKRFVIEKLHLPPDFKEKNENISLEPLCHTNNKILDF